MSHDLKVLADHRDALLLAEVAAWLHMLGKFHEDFLHGQHGLDTQIPSDLTSDYPRLHTLLTDPWPGWVWSGLPISELDAASLSIYDLIKDHRNRKAKTGLARLMWDAHGRGSGTEKGILNRFAPGQQTTVYPATALGFESSPIDLAALQERRKCLYSALEQWLDRLSSQSGHPSLTEWERFRNSFIQRIKREFRFTVAETRRPLNDVTLLDQTFASVALLKATLAHILLTGWKEPTQEAVADKFKWRFLRIGIDGPMFWGRAARVSDLLARRHAVESVLNEIRTPLEVSYPLGTEVYRDENGSIFIVPDIDDLLHATVQGQPLREILDDLAHKNFDGEARLTYEVSDATRNMLFLGRLATSEMPAPSADPRWLDSLWSNSTRNDICPVCDVRPQGPGDKARERRVCDICEQRRLDRSSEWVTTRTSTIWTDEVADENGYLALVVGTFSIEKWLSGEMLSSVLSFDPRTRQLVEPRSKTTYQFDYQQFVTEIENELRRKQSKQFTNTPLLSKLVPKPQKKGGPAQLYAHQVLDADLATIQPKVNHAHLLALAMLRQNPSFARVRRVWETTHTFWQEVAEQLQDKALIPWAPERLSIRSQDATNLHLGPFHTYEMVVEGIRLSVVWDAPNQRFISCDNLSYLEKPGLLGKPVARALQPGHRYSLEEPTGYGGANRSLGQIAIDKLTRLDPSYAPVIPILAEPRTFMALVPADRALAVAQAIKDKYEREMGKVRNRLPLHLGVVYAHRRTPLRAVLDAGRRMLRYPTRAVDASVESMEKSNLTPEGWPREVNLRLKIDGREATLTVPTVMGDNKTPDVWYPYWRVAGKPTDRTRWFIGPDGEHWVHVCDLRRGDTAAFTPSTFDFELLDTSARRFEVTYGGDGQRLGKDKRQRPYLLEQIAALEEAWAQIRALSTSQIKGLDALIEAKRHDWGVPTGTLAVPDPFRQFVADALREAGVYSPFLHQAAITGRLTDALEIHLTIHKEKP